MTAQHRNSRRVPNVLLRLLPGLVVVAVHGVTGLGLKQPVILADELGYLGNARYLAGVSHVPDLTGCQFYHFGYSLLLTPAFWLLQRPTAIYGAVLFINAMLMGGLFFLLAHVLVSYLETPPARARWIAFATCLYPSLLLYSSLALSECAFVTAFVAAIALFGRLLATGTARSAAAFGLAAAFLYTIHPRGLPVIAAITIYLVLLVGSRTMPAPRALIALASMGSLVALTRIVNHHLRALGWAGGGEFSATKLAGRVLPGTDFLALAERGLGQLLYLVLASHGLFLVGVAAGAWLICRKLVTGSARRALADPLTGVPILTMVASASVFVASCTSKLYALHGPTGVRGANIIHGRYNEAGAVVILALGLAFLARRRYRLRELAAAWIVVTVVVFAMSAVIMLEVEDAQRRHLPGNPEQVSPDRFVPAANVDPVNVPGVFPIVGLAGSLNLYWAALVTVSVMLVFCLVLGRSRRGSMAVVMAAFAAFAAFNHVAVRLPAESRNEPRLEFAEIAHRLGEINELSYDLRFFDSEFFYSAQYLFPDTVFNTFDSRREQAPVSEAVISGAAWPETSGVDARFVVRAEVCDNVLWLRPGHLQKRLPVASPEGVVLGSQPVQFVEEAGFHPRESIDAVAGRWTDGRAVLRIPLDPGRPPGMLGVETMVPGREGADLRVVANGVAMLNERISPRRQTRTFDLAGVELGTELVVELVSQSFSPEDESAGLEDSRRLGVFVVAVRVESHQSLAAQVLDGLVLAAEPVFGVPESGFYSRHTYRGAPARWTDGRASLRVPVDPRFPPRELEIQTVGPRDQPVQLRVLANDTELWNGEISLEGWRKTLSLEDVPADDELHIELLSNTFRPMDVEEGSRDPRTLGLMIRSIRLEN